MMSVEKLIALAKVEEASSFKDDPPGYSPAVGNDIKLSLDQMNLSGNKGFEKIATRSVSPERAKRFSKCTRCEAEVELADYHYGCPKCINAVVCICQRCRDKIPRCQIHQIDLIKRALKGWPADLSWFDYVSPTPTKFDNPLIHALKTHDDNLTTIYAGDSSLLNARTYIGYTPLHFAAHLGLVSGTSVLLSHGALTNARDDRNNTPLIIAIELDQPEIVKLLLQNGANIHSVCGFKETTALHAAAANGFPTLISFFLEQGAIIDMPSGRGTALQLSCRIGSFKCSSILLEKGGNPNARSEDAVGEPPIISAVRNDSAELVDLLVKYGANVDLTFTSKDDEFTALFIAVSSNFVDMARKLLGYGADINAVSKRGVALLMRAAALGFPKMCEMLIENGADIDWVNAMGINAVLAAAGWGKEEALDVLLERGASGKPPKVCGGKWKTLENFFREPLSKETKGRIMKKLRAAKHG
jgi:ankyrin repeat protein